MDIFFWIIIGALSGWIGYLANKSSSLVHIRPYILVGVLGAVLGGYLSQYFGVSDVRAGTLDTISAFNAIFTSALTVTLFVVLWNFFRKTSSD